MAVLPVCEKTIGVIAIVEMCEKCSHFRLMLAAEEMKIAQPETCEKYFVYYKENFERLPRGNTLSLNESCGNLHRHRSSAVVCLNLNFIYVFDRSFACFPNNLSIYSNPFKKNLRTSHDMFILLHVYFNFRCELFLIIEVKPRRLS